MKKKYACEIDCAACAAKVEDAIKKLDGVTDCRVNFMTQKMTFEAEDDRFSELLTEAVRVGRRIEPDFEVKM